MYHTELCPVAAGSKAWVCDRPIARIAGLNSGGGMSVCLSVVSVVCCQVEGRVFLLTEVFLTD
jgi:hypothetical protein